jgi:hypothetical protein
MLNMYALGMCRPLPINDAPHKRLLLTRHTQRDTRTCNGSAPCSYPSLRLIAMMAKTFENITDSAAVNYQLVLAQSTCSLNNQPPATAPLNLLTAPYIALVLLLRLLIDRRCQMREFELLSCACKRLCHSRLVPSRFTAPLVAQARNSVVQGDKERVACDARAVVKEREQRSRWAELTRVHHWRPWSTHVHRQPGPERASPEHELYATTSPRCLRATRREGWR